MTFAFTQLKFIIRQAFCILCILLVNIKRTITHPVGITIIYIVIGFCWIYFSDYLVSILVDPASESLRAVQTFKGTIFVLISALVIYTLISSLNYSLRKKIAAHTKDKDRLDRAQHLGKIGDWSYDVARGVINWSNPVYNIYEIDPKLPIPTRDEMREFYAEKDRLRMQHAVETAILDGKSYDLDTKIIVSSGEKWIRNTGIPIVKNNKTVRIEGIVQDITSRKTSENECKELAERLSAIANNLPGAIFQYVLHPDGSDELQYLCEGSEQLWGIKPKDGMTDNDLIWSQIDKCDIENVLASIKESSESLKLWQTTWRSHHPENGLRWHEGIGQPKRLDDGSTVWNSIILDITDRRKAQMEKQELAERLNALADNLPGILFQYRLDEDGKDSIEYLSQGTEEYFGLTPEQIIEDINRAWVIFHPEDLPKVRQEIVKSAASMKNLEMEWRIEHPKKGILWQQCIASPKKGPDNSIIWDTLILDITDRKKAELELVESKNLLEKTINSIKEAVFIINPEGRKILMVNEAVEQIFGYKPEELMGKNTSLLYPSTEKFEEFASVGEPTLDHNGVFHTEFQMRHKSGAIIQTENTVTPLSKTDGFKAGVVSVVRDITEKKESVKKLAERDEYLKSISEHASDGILACDENGRLVFFNKQLREWVGYENSQIEPKEWPAHYKLYTEDGSRLLEKDELSLMKALKNGEVSNHRFMVKTEGKPERFLESNGKALYDREGNLTGAMVVLRDITDQINKDIETSNAILEALDRERIEIASEIHDNLTQTLSIVSQSLKNLVLENHQLIKSTKFKKAQQFLQIAINDSRDLSHRIMPKSIEDFGLVTATDELIDSLQHAHKIKIDFEYNTEFRLDKNTELHIYRIIQEGISNSIKHAHASSITVSLSYTNSTLIAKIEDNGIGLQLADNSRGIGIRTMKNRALKLNATLEFKSHNGGVIVELKVPLN